MFGFEKVGVMRAVAALGGVLALFASLSIFSYYGFILNLPSSVRPLVALQDFQTLTVRATGYFVAAVMLARFTVLMLKATSSTAGTRLFAELGWKRGRRVLLIFSKFVRAHELKVVVIFSALFFCFSFFSNPLIAVRSLGDLFYVLIIYYAVSVVYFRRLFVMRDNLKEAPKHRALQAGAVFLSLSLPYASYLLGHRIYQDVDADNVEVHVGENSELGAVILRVGNGILFRTSDGHYIFYPNENVTKMVFL